MRSIDLRVIADVVEFVRGPGCVLDFSDSSFSDFFASELNVNIDDPIYAEQGGSKGKRLRCFLQKIDDATAVRTLRALWEHRAEFLDRTGQTDPVLNAEKRFLALIARMETAPASGPNQPPRVATADARPRDAKRSIIDLTKHEFDVALSFPGESRKLVEEVAGALNAEMGPDRCFYDNFYKAQLARPSLDVLLQDIYRRRSKLVVVFLGSDYQRKDWCGIEFRAIREIILERGYGRVMFVRVDDGQVDGIFRTDGYIDARQHSAAEIANFIQQRVELI
jgi:hypothetical protein